MEQPATADLCDEHGDAVEICAAPFKDFGGRKRFHGVIRTVLCQDDNGLARALLSGQGEGCVLVVDAGGSQRFALMGDNMAQIAIDNGWAGVVIYGAVRDTAALAGMDIGVKALGAVPRRGSRLGTGEMNVPVSFCGATFTPGWTLYSDEDGVVAVAP
ncbi:ribonuclease E activity regulator RraA [Caulobacter sp. 17J65-9]|uniref:ribonuclease E activity regulator RraA n=1 Tax=Caulobacter sp. 17J65-9 TaxID=2709382 RepID=UPI001969ABA6|nr:ribonuclease E activity regulator RraA [Caulobacter sp. 17J65-9]